MKRLLLSVMTLCWLGCGSSTGKDTPDSGDPITGTTADAGGIPGTDKPSDAGTSFDAGSGSDAGTLADAGTATDAGGGLDAGLPVDAGDSSDAGDAMDAGSSADAGGTDAGPRFTTREEIVSYLEGKTLLMTGANVPSHPHGYDEDVNYGSATQCYQSVTKQLSGGTFHETDVFGTLRNASTIGERGECDHDTASSTASLSTTNVIIENVQVDGSCFDATFYYPAFAAEGRGSLSQDGLTLSLELFFRDQATGLHCADGAPGARTVLLRGQPFTGNAVQVYTVSP